MRVLPEGLQAHLDSGATTLCWCWKLTRLDQRVLGFTDHDASLAFDGVDYQADSGFSATELQSSLGLSVDNIDVQGALSSDAITEADISVGLYDGAEVEIWRVNWSEPSQRLLMRKGNLGEISRGENYFSVEVRGLAAQLQQKQGRVYQSCCDAVLGDGRCGVNLDQADLKASASVAGLSGDQALIVEGIDDKANGWFGRGVLEFTSGDNIGLRYPIQLHQITSGIVMLSVWSPFVYPVAIGDGLALTAGCDKRFASCVDKFANGVNFRGFPHMPGNDYVTTYPQPDDDDLSGNYRYDTY
ncbi:DUF2163 domain-containing protein [Cohaesibacter celericrescens]|uniref:Beta tubulin n=1 Tax=Cohaesibacter celericrescens TaxID=2067669 RepID=A0A2N5XQL5_9HYPH|nr:DUF2163 domain-containing protein [Cohaesibacter celericrescens]PLW76799.1 beta tubulin [Cohaesibacter celericrescens]